MQNKLNSTCFAESMKRTSVVCFLSFLSSLIPLSSSLAYDTDIFFSPEQGNPSNHANVIFMLDNSGSMKNDDGTSTRRIDDLKVAMDVVLENANDVNVGMVVFDTKTANRPLEEQYKPGAQPLYQITSINDDAARSAMKGVVSGIVANKATPLVDALLESAMMMTGGTIQNSAGGVMMVDFDHPRAAADALETDDERLDDEPDATNGFTITHTVTSTTATNTYTTPTPPVGSPPIPDGVTFTIDGNRSIRKTVSGATTTEVIRTFTTKTKTVNDETGSVSYSYPPTSLDSSGNPLPQPKHQVLITTELFEYPDPRVGLCQPNHIVFLSDGNPNGNGVKERVKELLDIDSCSGTGDEECGLDLAGWIGGNDITVHTVGFHISNDFLPSIAEATGGNYYEAKNGLELVDVFQRVLTTIREDDTNYAPPSMSISQFNRLTQSDDVFYALFNPLPNATWNGNLKKYKLGVSGDTVTILDANNSPAIDAAGGRLRDSARSFWSGVTDGNNTEMGGAAALMGTSRNLLTHRGSIPGGGAQLTTPLSSVSAADLGVNASYKDDLLSWLNGIDVKDENENESNTDRRYHMGDPVHSTPVKLNYPGQSVVYVGTNEGFLHAINSDSGSELYAFIPEELLENLGKFYVSVGAYHRPFGLDGAISVLHVDENTNGLVDGSDKAYLYVGMRRGGRSYYAFDVTNPSSPRLAWRAEGGTGNFSRLGQSWSKATPAKIMFKGSPRHVLIFGGGYDINKDPVDRRNDAPRSNTDSMGNSVYIVDAFSGERLWSADAHLGNGSMRFAIPADLRVIDINGDGFADRIYAGDLGGQIWRFDIRGYHQSSEGTSDLVKGGVMARLGDSSNPPMFYNEPDVAFLNHQGDRFMSISIGSGWRANPSDTGQSNRFYMVRDNSPLSIPGGYGKQTGSSWSAITNADLMDVTDTTVASSDALNENGWMLRLTDSGEKNMSRSVTINDQVVFTTYTPLPGPDQCSPPSGRGNIYAVNAINGNPALALSSGGSGPGVSPGDRRQNLATQTIPPAPSAAIVQSGGQIYSGIITGTETTLANLPFGQLTRRTYWQNMRRGGMTPAECRQDSARNAVCR